MSGGPTGARSRRGAVGLALAAMVVVAALVGATGPVPEPAPGPGTAAAPAAEAGQEAAGPPVHRTDGVEGRMDTYASQVSGAHIWDLEVVGTTVYAAGKFTHVVEAAGSWPRRNQPFLAAFDTRSGRWRSEWRPRVNRPVYSLERLPSGAIVAGGEFTRANGAVAEGLVALDPTTGATDRRFQAGVRRPGSRHHAVVRDLFVKGNRLYAAGHFGRAVGPAGVVAVTKVTRFNASTGRPDRRWHPRVRGRSAWAVAVSSDNRRVHIGGEFTSVNGGRGTSQLATVSVQRGRLTGGWDHGSNARRWPSWPVGGVIFDLDVWGNNLYVAGAEHFWERRNSRTGRSIRFQSISNDAQSVDVHGRRVYIGCHCYHRAPARQVWEIDARSGRPLPGRTGSLQSGDGTWATAVAPDGCLWLGGDFVSTSSLAGRGTGSFWVGRLARLCPSGGPESAAVPEVRPGPVNPPGWSPRAAP